MTDHFKRTGEASHAATAAELLDPTTTRVDVKELLQMVLSLESPRGLLEFVETRGKVVLAVTHDGVELTGSTTLVLGFGLPRSGTSGRCGILLSPPSQSGQEPTKKIRRRCGWLHSPLVCPVST